MRKYILFIFIIVTIQSFAYIPSIYTTYILSNSIDENTCPLILSYVKQSSSGTDLVKFSTSFLPKVDSIGHTVLHLNEVVVSYLIDNSILDEATKKNLILYVIHLAQNGDAYGSKILETYYDLVNCLL